MPGGVPRHIQIYDNGGPEAPHNRGKMWGTVDRYTVVFRQQRDGYCHYLSMSPGPYDPQGVCMGGESPHPIDRPSYSHLGHKIRWPQLAVDCRLRVLREYESLWHCWYQGWTNRLLQIVNHYEPPVRAWLGELERRAARECWSCPLTPGTLLWFFDRQREILRECLENLIPEYQVRPRQELVAIDECQLRLKLLRIRYQEPTIQQGVS